MEEKDDLEAPETCVEVAGADDNMYRDTRHWSAGNTPVMNK